MRTCRTALPVCWSSFNPRTESAFGTGKTGSRIGRRISNCSSRLDLPMWPRNRPSLWKIRAGMFPSVGSVRKSGTTVIIEDVAFPIETLADAAHDLTRLFHETRVRERHHLRSCQGRKSALRHHPELQQSGVVDQYARLSTT